MRRQKAGLININVLAEQTQRKQNEEDTRERWELVRDLKLNKKKGILYAYYLT